MTSATPHEPIDPATDERGDIASPPAPRTDEVASPTPAEAPQTALSWLGEAAIAGLVHCACAHHQLHPELVSLASGKDPAAATPRTETTDRDDA